MASATTVASAPTVSDSRPPARVRARMSRPMASVPNQWPPASEGAADSAFQSGRCGSWPGSSRASQHAAASTAITARHRRAERGRGRGESMPAS